jgi:hypothetical protein
LTMSCLFLIGPLSLWQLLWQQLEWNLICGYVDIDRSITGSRDFVRPFNALQNNQWRTFFPVFHGTSWCSFKGAIESLEFCDMVPFLLHHQYSIQCYYWRVPLQIRNDVSRIAYGFYQSKLRFWYLRGAMTFKSHLCSLSCCFIIYASLSQEKAVRETTSSLHQCIACKENRKMETHQFINKKLLK